MNQLFLDTGIQAFPEPVMAGSFSLSSRIRLLPQLTYFALERQFARTVQGSDPRRLVFLFHSGHWIGGPGVMDEKLLDRFST